MNQDEPKHTKAYYAVNLITWYRLFATPLLLFLIFSGRQNLFALFLIISLFTDLIDGFLARRYKVTSVFGSKLDSIADDLTFACAVVAVFVFKMDFIKENLTVILILLGLYFFQLIIALIKYRKITSFHTYLAKIAAILQGLFFISLFLFTETVYPLFYLAAGFTMLDLTEEIIMVFVLPKWKADVKGLFWIDRAN